MTSHGRASGTVIHCQVSGGYELCMSQLSGNITESILNHSGIPYPLTLISAITPRVCLIAAIHSLSSCSFSAEMLNTRPGIYVKNYEESYFTAKQCICSAAGSMLAALIAIFLISAIPNTVYRVLMYMYAVTYMVDWVYYDDELP